MGGKWSDSKIRPLEERFREKVSINNETGCHEWTAARDNAGYGMISLGGSLGAARAHRVGLDLAGVAVPEGMHVDHLCRVRHCVNIEHLEVVTPAENLLRGAGAPALNARKTHCKRGHALTEDNIYRQPSAPSRRSCRKCRHQAWLRRKALAALASTTLLFGCVPQSGDIPSMIRARWAGTGHEERAVRIARCESGFNPHAQNRRSTAYGVWQFLDRTWRGTGIAKTSDAWLQTEAAYRLWDSGNRVVGDLKGSWRPWECKG